MRALLFGFAVAACSSHSDAPIDAAVADTADAATAVDLHTTPNQWVWVPFAGTTCGNGSTAGIGIDRAPTAGGDLVVYFEGGGACWDKATREGGKAMHTDVTCDAATLAADAAGRDRSSDESDRAPHVG